MLTDFAMSKLSSMSTPAWLRFPITKEILANKDFLIKSPNTGILKVKACQAFLN